MLQPFLLLLAPMLFGAQCLLTLVLVKGDLCPGQRGRIHRVLPAIAILWLAVASIKIQAILVTFALAYFYSQVQTNKTRVKGPIWVMHLANGLAFSYTMTQVAGQSFWVSGLATLVQVFLTGALFAHLLLTIAKTRLQAFHRILPVVGVISAMLMTLVVLAQAYRLEETALNELTSSLLIGLGLVVVSIVIWCWHLISGRTVGKIQLTLAQLLMLGGMFTAQALFLV